LSTSIDITANSLKHTLNKLTEAAEGICIPQTSSEMVDKSRTELDLSLMNQSSDNYYDILFKKKLSELKGLTRTTFFYNEWWHSLLGPLLLKTNDGLGPNLSTKIAKILVLTADSLGKRIELSDKVQLLASLERMLQLHVEQIGDMINTFQTNNKRELANLIEEEIYANLTAQFSGIGISNYALRNMFQSLVEIAETNIHTIEKDTAICKASAMNGMQNCDCRGFEAVITLKAPAKTISCYEEQVSTGLLKEANYQGSDRYSFNKHNSVDLISKGNKDYELNRLNSNTYEYDSVRLLTLPIVKMREPILINVTDQGDLLLSSVIKDRTMTVECKLPDASNDWARPIKTQLIEKAGLLKISPNCKYHTGDHNIEIRPLRVMKEMFQNNSKDSTRDKLVKNITNFLQLEIYESTDRHISKGLRRSIMNEFSAMAQSELSLRESIRKSDHSSWWNQLVNGMPWGWLEKTVIALIALLAFLFLVQFISLKIFHHLGKILQQNHSTSKSDIEQQFKDLLDNFDTIEQVVNNDHLLIRSLISQWKSLTKSKLTIEDLATPEPINERRL
jgi:hypothetical protein